MGIAMRLCFCEGLLVQNQAGQLTRICVVAQRSTDWNVQTLLNCGATACAWLQVIQGRIYADLDAMRCIAHITDQANESFF